MITYKSGEFRIEIRETPDNQGPQNLSLNGHNRGSHTKNMSR